MLAPLLLSCAALVALVTIAFMGLIPFLSGADGVVLLLASVACVATICALDGYATDRRSDPA